MSISLLAFVCETLVYSLPELGILTGKVKVWDKKPQSSSENWGTFFSTENMVWEIIKKPETEDGDDDDEVGINLLVSCSFFFPPFCLILFLFLAFS